jgi:hypothetical protein
MTAVKCNHSLGTDTGILRAMGPKQTGQPWSTPRAMSISAIGANNGRGICAAFCDRVTPWVRPLASGPRRMRNSCKKKQHALAGCNLQVETLQLISCIDSKASVKPPNRYLSSSQHQQKQFDSQASLAFMFENMDYSN